MSKALVIFALLSVGSMAFAAPVISTTCDLGKGKTLSITNDTLVGPPSIEGPTGHLAWNGESYAAGVKAGKGVDVIYAFGMSTQIAGPANASVTKFKAALTLTEVVDGILPQKSVEFGDVVCSQVHGFTLQ